MKSFRRSALLSVLGTCAWAWTSLLQAADLPSERIVPPLESAAEILRQRLATDLFPLEEVWAGAVKLRSPALTTQLYAQRDYRPAWLIDASPRLLADELLQALRAADSEGLRPTDYHLDAIATAMQEARSGAKAITSQQLLNLDMLLTDAFLTYASHLVSGRLDPRRIDRDWGYKPRSQNLVSTLEETLASGAIAESLAALAPAHPGYQRLRMALAYYRTLQQAGGWPQIDAGPKLEKGVRDPRIRELRARLRATGDLDSGPVTRPTEFAASSGLIKVSAADSSGRLYKLTERRDQADAEALFNAGLEQAVKRFQRRHGLLVDGVVGPNTLDALNISVEERIRQIEANLERWRWLPNDLGRRHILINIPDFEMRVIEDGNTVMDTRAVVGKEKRPTPLFSGSMSYLVLNPAWHIPWKIAVEDMLPQLRHDPYSLFRQNIHVYDMRNGGQEIDPGTVNWFMVNKSNFHYRLRQDPGPGNALGKIKFMFPNAHSVYLHDTSAPHLFRRTQRAYSSGCIRIDKPIELAEYLLRGNPRWTRQTLASATEAQRERVVQLPERVPVHLLYWTAWVDEQNTVHFRKDIYQRDPPLVDALNAIRQRTDES